MVFTYLKKTAVLYISAVFLLVLDRFLKVFASFNFSHGLVGNFFNFNFAKNYYIAFSLPLFGLWLNLFIGLVILSLIGYFIWLIIKAKGFLYGQEFMLLDHKKPAHLEAGFLLLVILGASSNLFDRLKFGYVIDYFDLSYFTVFNLADVMIFLGVLGLILSVKKHS